MSSPAVVLDASAVLCLMLSEPGAERVEAYLGNAVLSVVNYAEVIGKLVDLGLDADEIAADIADLSIEIVAVDQDLAEGAAKLRTHTRSAGLSLGDRFCLALAQRMGIEAITTDRAWAKLGTGIGVRVDVVR